jgi:hypothetical protein
VVGDRLVQPVASGGDPCVDVGLVRDMKCAFFSAPVKGRGSNSASIAETGT